jgi:P27 family predicted phage terminase small subunit
LKILEGNAGRRPLAENEPKPDAAPEAGAPPQHLSARAKAEWRRMYEPLRRCNLLTVADLSAFAAYCASYGRWEEAEDRLRKDGMIITTPNKLKQAHPCVAISRQERVMMKMFLTEFGATPVSRSRLVIAGTPPPAKPDDPQDGEEHTPEVQAGEFTGLIGKRPN